MSGGILLHRGAVHEAGHAVMARLLGANLGRVTIDLSNPYGAGHTQVIWAGGEPDAEDDYRVAGASSVCLCTFGFDISHDEGTRKDQERIVEILLDKYPTNAVERDRYRDRMDDKIERQFRRPTVQAAIKALVAALMRDGLVEGTEARMIIDQHLGGDQPPKLA